MRNLSYILLGTAFGLGEVVFKIGGDNVSTWKTELVFFLYVIGIVFLSQSFIDEIRDEIKHESYEIKKINEEIKDELYEIQKMIKR